jgi:hypothetical protein
MPLKAARDLYTKYWGKLHNSIGGSQKAHQALTHKVELGGRLLLARFPMNTRFTSPSMKLGGNQIALVDV